MRIWPAIAARLQQLQRLHIWIDHDDSRIWSLVDERAVLSSITTPLTPGSAARLKYLRFDLPKLHPRYEDAARHFTEGSREPPPYVTIERRLRQRHFYVETAPGTGTVVDTQDFPVLFELVDYTAEGPGAPMSLEEVEEWEREIWEAGGDPVNEVFETVCPGRRAI